MAQQKQERERLENLHTECLIYLKIIHFGTFKKLFEILAVSCGNVAFSFTKESLLMNTMNEVQKYIVHLDLRCDSENLTYYFEQPTVLYINAKEFYNDALRLKDKKSVLYLYIRRDSPTNFNLNFLSSTGDCSTSFIFRSLNENRVKKYSFPKFHFNLSCTMKAQLFHRLIGERKKSDTFELIIQGKTLQFHSDNKISSERKDTLFESERSVLFARTPESVRAIEMLHPDIPFLLGRFSCRKINSFYKLPSICENVTLHLNYEKPDSPLTCEYKICSNFAKLFLFFAVETPKEPPPIVQPTKNYLPPYTPRQS